MADVLPRSDGTGDVGDAPCDCPVCLAAHTVGVHFAQNAASNSDGGGLRGSFHPNAHALTYRPTTQLKIFLSCEPHSSTSCIATVHMIC